MILNSHHSSPAFLLPINLSTIVLILGAVVPFANPYCSCINSMALASNSYFTSLPLFGKPRILATDSGQTTILPLPGNIRCIDSASKHSVISQSAKSAGIESHAIDRSPPNSDDSISLAMDWCLYNFVSLAGDALFLRTYKRWMVVKNIS